MGFLPDGGQWGRMTGEHGSISYWYHWWSGGEAGRVV